jgi:hypothetical protein
MSTMITVRPRDIRMSYLHTSACRSLNRSHWCSDVAAYVEPGRSTHWSLVIDASRWMVARGLTVAVLEETDTVL